MSRSDPPVIKEEDIAARQFVSTREAAAIVGVSEGTLRKWRQHGAVKAYPAGGTMLVWNVAELHAYRDWRLNHSGARGTERVMTAERIALEDRVAYLEAKVAELSGRLTTMEFMLAKGGTHGASR